jgi:hypothetical protein
MLMAGQTLSPDGKPKDLSSSVRLIGYDATDFDVIGNCGIGGTPPAITCSRHAPTAVKGGIPLQNELIRFP